MNSKRSYPFVLSTLVLAACSGSPDAPEPTGTAGEGGSGPGGSAQGGSAEGGSAQGGSAQGGSAEGGGALGGAGEGGTATLCAPGATMSCYEGPPGTEGVGHCVGGTSTCEPDGAAWGPCAGQVLPDAEDPNVAGDESCDGIASGEAIWQAVGVDTLNDFASDVAVDGAGNLVVVGEFEGTLNLGGSSLVSAGSRDVFVAKYDSAGNHVWSLRFGDAGTQGVAAVAVDAFNAIVLTGSFQGEIDFGGGSLDADGTSDIYLAKLDAGGAHLGSKLLTSRTTSCSGGLCFVDPTGNKFPRDLAIASDGRIAVAGTFTGHWGGCTGAACDDGDEHGFVRVYNSSLSLQEKLTVAGASRVNAASFDTTGGVYVGGAFTGTTSFGGAAPLTATGTLHHGFVARLDQNLVGSWSRNLEASGTGQQLVNAVVTLSDGGVAIAGRSDGATNLGAGAAGAGEPLFLAKYLATGAFAWGEVYDASDSATTFPATSFLAEDSYGNIVASATLTGSITVDGDTHAMLNGGAALLKLDPLGLPIWTRALASTGAVRVFGGALGGDDRIALAGFYHGMIDLGLGPLTSGGGNDTLVLVLEP